MSSRIIPSLRYADAKRAVTWLQEAFGLEAQMVVEDGDRIVHAQMTYGSGMLMLGSGGESAEYDSVVGVDGDRSNFGLFVIVEDVDTHYTTAQEAGAEIVMPPEPQDYGGSLYTCKDFEGNVWSFGSYDPWAELSS